MSSVEQLQVGEFKLWLLEDGARTWVAARTKEEALSLYHEMVGPLDEDWEVDVSPCGNIEIVDIDEPGQPRHKASELMQGLVRPEMIACSEY